MTDLAAWQNFYIIVGSSAGALIGLQFVVMTLMEEVPIARAEAELIGSAFATPTIVYFSTVLFIAAVFSAPWAGGGIPVCLCGVSGAAGMAYCLVVSRRQKSQKTYEADLEDRFFYFFIPFASYFLLLVMAAASGAQPRGSLFGLAAALLMLLFIGIRNAWDTVTYGIFVRQGKKVKRKGRR
jgi:hypothetical protein